MAYGVATRGYASRRPDSKAALVRTGNTAEELGFQNGSTIT
jgi:hypothetical protein